MVDLPCAADTAAPYRARLAQVEQIGQWKFLVFRGTFSTKLLVEEDFKANTVSNLLVEQSHGLLTSWAERVAHQAAIGRGPQGQHSESVPTANPELESSAPALSAEAPSVCRPFRPCGPSLRLTYCILPLPQVKFRLAKPGLMRRFQGDWVIRPFNQERWAGPGVNHAV